jgi:hypothetical protein
MTLASCSTFLNVLVTSFPPLVLAHMLDLQEYGVRVIITEISKEVENNNIARVNVYASQYVPRRNVAAGGLENV